MPSSDDSGVELVVVPRGDPAHQYDERWLDQVALFYDDLRTGGAAVRIDSTPVPGAKGDIASVIIALGSAGAIKSALAAFKAFLGRERIRSLELSYMVKGKKQTITLRGDMDNATLERLAMAAIERSSSA